MLSNSSVLNSMTIRLKHMHYLETSTYVMGSKVNLGSLGVLQKRAGYVSLERHNLLSSSLSCRNPTGSCLATVSFFFLPCPQSGAGYCISSSSSSSSFFFFLLSSFFFFLSTCQYLRHATFDIDQTWRKWPVPWQLLAHKQWWGQRSRWGHWGQKGQNHQNCYFSYRLHGMVMWLMHIHQLDSLYKSYRFKKISGVIWGHRGQKVIFTKIAISPTDYMVWSCDSCIFIN